MNFLASYDWIKQYIDLRDSAEKIGAELSLCGPSIERYIPSGEQLNGIVLGKITSIEPHPDKKVTKLRIAYVYIGSTHTTPLRIVCGGSNLSQNQLVAVATIGSRVRWHGEGELVELKPTEIRGVSSEGMICAANEIGLYDAFPHSEHEILDIRKELPEMNANPGTPLASVLGLNDDTVMNIEVTTNRPDLMCITGIAREISVLTNKKLKLPNPTSVKSLKPLTSGQLSVFVNEPLLCPRYMAVRIDNVTIKQSPWWLRKRLLSAGIRPINNLVDITNFVLLELGQPMHVFDSDKINGNKIIIRAADNSETIQALDGKEYSLDKSMLVIADAVKPVAIAGIMGGELSSVTSQTSSIIFEAATFDPVSVRRTSHALNLISDSQIRFEKGLSTESTATAIARATELCLELAGGTVASKLVDVRREKYKPLKFSITVNEVNSLIGETVSEKQMVSIMSSLGFKTRARSGKLTVIVPSWRDHDIESGRDIVEEIARIFGYGNIKPVFPPGMNKSPRDENLIWEDRLRDISKAAGLTGVFTYSFVSGVLLEKVGFNPSKLLRVQNTLSDDFEYMRTSLLPSMIQVVVDNQERFQEQKLFELANVYPRSLTDLSNDVWTELPDEQPELAAAYYDSGDTWKRAKGFVEKLINEAGVKNVIWNKMQEDAFWHPGRSAQAFVNEALIATVGEIHPIIHSKFKLDGRLSLVSVHVRNLTKYATTSKQIKPIPQYPQAKRDLAIIVDREVSVSDIVDIMIDTGCAMREISWFDTFEGEGIQLGKKSVAFHLSFGANDRTLEAAEVDEAMNKIIESLKNKFKATVRE